LSPDRTIRVAAIDVGTNSVHLVVADLTADEGITVVEKQRRQVALGEGGLNGRRLSKAAQKRAMDALKEFRTACDVLQVSDIHCAATSAVREAENGVEFCRQVKAETGIHVRIISGLDEARLIYLGARPHVDFSQGRALLVDLGGGSTEFILCDPHTAFVKASLPLGHIRATDLHRTSDPLTKDEVKALRSWTREALRPLGVRLHPGDVSSVVGTSGTIRCLARMATLDRGGLPTEDGQGLVLTRKEVDRLIRRFQKVPADRLERIPGMDERRKHTLPAGAVVVSEILRFIAQDSLTTSNYSLRDGLLWDWIGRHRPELERSRREADPRRRTVLGVMERYSVDEGHAEHVARLACTLFDATRSLHRLRIDDRRLLEFAALLHDVGHHIAGEDHHKHGQYLIRHTRMSGFTAPEIDELALIVRYHRGKRPKKRDLERLEDTARHRVRVLSALLAVADGFDRGHDRNVSDIDVELRDGRLYLTGRTRTRSHLEQWAVHRRCRALSSALGVPIRIDVAQGEPLATRPGTETGQAALHAGRDAGQSGVIE